MGQEVSLSVTSPALLQPPGKVPPASCSLGPSPIKPTWPVPSQRPLPRIFWLGFCISETEKYAFGLRLGSLFKYKSIHQLGVFLNVFFYLTELSWVINIDMTWEHDWNSLISIFKFSSERRLDSEEIASSFYTSYFGQNTDGEQFLLSQNPKRIVYYLFINKTRNLHWKWKHVVTCIFQE